MSRMGSLATHDEPRRPFRCSSAHWTGACSAEEASKRDELLAAASPSVAHVTPAGFTPTLAPAAQLPAKKRRESWSSTDDEGCCVPISRRPGDDPPPPPGASGFSAFGRRFPDQPPPLLGDAVGRAPLFDDDRRAADERAFERRRRTRALPNVRVRRRSPSPESSECSSPEGPGRGLRPRPRPSRPSRRRL